MRKRHLNQGRFVGLLLLLAPMAAFAAPACPAVETYLLDKGLAESAPWRVVSGSAVECSFMTRNSSVNFGFNHMVAKSAEDAVAAAVDMRKAIAGTSRVEPMPSLGESGFTYQPKKPDGSIDRTSMFFYGHRGAVDVSGYLNLGNAITPAQRELAANLIAGTLRIAGNSNALAKATNCRYADPILVKRLLPGDDVATIVPDANNCVLSSGGSVITVAVTREARDWASVQRLLKSGGCAVDAVHDLGTVAGIAHHCSQGNPRAEVLFVAGGRTYRMLFAPAAEPSADARAALVDLARAALRN